MRTRPGPYGPVNLDTPLGDEIDARVPRTSMAWVTQGRVFGVPETPRTALGELPRDRHTQRPQQPIQHTVSAAERGRHTWVERQLTRAAQEVQDRWAMNPRCKPAEIRAAYELGLTQDPFTLHGFSADTAYERVTEYRREHRHQSRHSTPDLVSTADFAYAMHRSEKTLSRWLGDIISDIADDQNMWPRSFVTGVAQEMSDLSLTTVKRLSTHQHDLLRQRVHSIDIDGLEMPEGD